MPAYTYTIFDSNPSDGSTPWPDHQQVGIEAASDDEATAKIETIMAQAANGLNPADGYDEGQELHCHIWNANGVIVGSPTYELTADDLGIEPEPESVADDQPIEFVSSFSANRTYAVVSDITPNRATIESLHDDYDDAVATCDELCEVLIVSDDTPVGKRVWHSQNWAKHPTAELADAR